MTDDLIFFDNDCFSNFLDLQKADILLSLFPGRIVIPFEVYHELKNEGTPALIRNQVDQLEKSGGIVIPPPFCDDYEYDYECFASLTEPEDGSFGIGKGEAAALVYALMNKATIASNNMRDVSTFVKRYKIKQMTTGYILCEAISKSIITIEEAASLWTLLIMLGNKLPTDDFSDYYSLYYLKGRI